MWGVLFANKGELALFENEVLTKISQKASHKLVAKQKGLKKSILYYSLLISFSEPSKKQKSQSVSGDYDFFYSYILLLLFYFNWILIFIITIVNQILIPLIFTDIN